MSQILRLRVVPQFLAALFDGVGTKIRKDGLATYVDLDYESLNEASSFTAEDSLAAIYHPSSGAWEKISLETLIAGLPTGPAGPPGPVGPPGPSGSGSGDMLKSDNLSGLTNLVTARSNLGIPDVLTNERLAKTAAYTVVAADRGKTIALGGSSLYTLTFNLASGYDATHASKIINEDTGRGKTIVLESGTSVSNNSVGTGAKTFTTQSGLNFVVGKRLRMRATSGTSNYMTGIVSSYSGTSLIVNVDLTNGTGSYADWQIGNEFILWPLQTLTVYSSNNTWQYNGQGRYLAPSSAQVFVDPLGADNNDGLVTGAGAFKTLTAACATVWKQFDHQNNLPVIGVTSGMTIIESVSLTQLGQPVGASTVYIVGVGGKFIWKPVSGFCIQFGDNSIPILRNIKFDGTGTTGNIAISCHQGICDINDGIEFGSFPSGYHFFADTNCKINFNSDYTISGGCAYHINLTGGGNQVAFNAPIVTTVSGSPAFSGYLRIFGAGSGITFSAGQTWVGSFASGMQQATITGPSGIYTAGLTLPGTIPHAESNGGQFF